MGRSRRGAERREPAARAHHVRVLPVDRGEAVLPHSLRPLGGLPELVVGDLAESALDHRRPHSSGRPILPLGRGAAEPVSLAIRLLRRPGLARGGRPIAPPRGTKSWGVLAYLLLCAHPPSRRELAELLFADADDPLEALRWSLAQLRRSLGEPRSLRGHPPALDLPAGTEVDVHLLTSGRQVAPSSVGPLSAELLEGLSFASSPAFESWPRSCSSRPARPLPPGRSTRRSSGCGARRPRLPSAAITPCGPGRSWRWAPRSSTLCAGATRSSPRCAACRA